MENAKSVPPLVFQNSFLNPQFMGVFSTRLFMPRAKNGNCCPVLGNMCHFELTIVGPSILFTNKITGACEASPFYNGKPMRDSDLIKVSLEDALKALEASVSRQIQEIKAVSHQIVKSLLGGNKVLLCGNGGSAADSQHIAAEFVNRFRLERRPLPAVALTTDTSILTAIANDYSYDEVFAKQVIAIGKEGDVIIGISTSGSSKNVIRALKAAKENGLVTVGLTGSEGKAMEDVCDFLLKASTSDTPRIQEFHIFVGHVICDLVERSLFKE